MEEILGLPELWSELKAEKRPIVLYGMGDGADKIVRICDELEIPIAGVFASDDFVRHNKYKHWTVKRLSQLEEEFPKMVILLAFGSVKARVMNFVDEVSRKHTLFIPDLPVTGTEYFNKKYLEANWDKFRNAYELFEDERSRKLFINMLKYKLSGRREYLLEDVVSREEMMEELFHFGNSEIFVDAGAYRGDTIEEFVGLTKGSYKKIIGLEPDGKNYKKLKANIEELPKVSVIEGAAWNEDELLYFEPKSGRSGRVSSGVPNTRGVKIDNAVENHEASYIKYDVEGAELQALEGSVETIKNCYPKLLVSAYHRPEDLWKLPLFIKNIAPEYSFYLRRNPGYPAWDINLICIKEF